MKRKLMRAAALLLTALMALTILSGCGEKNDSVAQKTIRFYGWGEPEEKTIFTELISDFMKENPDIKVIYENVPSDYVGKMDTMLAGNPPDVLYVPDGDFGRWVSTGVLKTLQPYLDQENWKQELELDKMWPGAVDRYRYDGSKLGQGDVYALPKDIGPTVIYYNKDLFDKMDVAYPDPEKPMSFAELLDKAQKLTTRSADGSRIEQYGIGPAWWESLVWSNGGEVVDPVTGTFKLTEPAGLEAMQFIGDLVNKYKVSPTPAASSSMSDDQMFLTGKVGMVFGLRYKVPAYRKLNFDWDVAPLPAGKTGKSAGWSGSVGIAMSAKSPYPDEAFKLIAYLGGRIGQEKQASTGFNIPNYPDMASTDLFLQPGQKPENAKVFIEMAKIEKPGPWNYYSNNKWWDILNQNLYKIWDGSESAEKVLAGLQPRIEQAIKEENPQYFK